MEIADKPFFSLRYGRKKGGAKTIENVHHTHIYTSKTNIDKDIDICIVTNNWYTKV